MKPTLYCLAAGMLLASCAKENADQNVNTPGATDLGELTINKNFNWSSSIKGKTLITLNASDNFNSQGRSLYITDDQGNRLVHEKVKDGQVNTYFTVPQSDEKYYAWLPSTNDKVEITGAGHFEMQVHTDIENDMAGVLNNLEELKGKKSTNGINTFVGTEMLSNGGFGTNSFVSFGSSSVPGQWYKFDNNFEYTTANGSKVIKAKSSKSTDMYQGWVPTPGDSFKVSADFNTTGSYRGSLLIYFFDSGFNMISYEGYHATSGSSNLSFSGVVPTGAATAAVGFNLKRGSYIDNVSLLEGPAITDSDNDGVADGDDEFPNDANRAYTSSFPTSGYQTLAFEDLWPAQGDYDFNDLVISTDIQYTADANNNKVDATVTISLDAMGAGNSNGLALRLLGDSKQVISNNIIASVSGDASLDPNNTNGIIVFNDAKAAQSDYYTNNGVGPDKTPDVFTFTITFNSNAGSQNLVPDIYIYSTNDRGREIHLDGFTGSSAANTAYYNTKMDYQGTYNTATGLPWAIEVITANKSFNHPKEKVNILVAYPQFQTWAESNGLSAQNWLQNPTLSEIFQFL